MNLKEKAEALIRLITRIDNCCENISPLGYKPEENLAEIRSLINNELTDLAQSLQKESKTDVGEVEKLRDKYYKDCVESIGGVPKIIIHPYNLFDWFIDNLSKLQTKEEKEKVNKEAKCKYVKREGESCTLNDNCKYPNCEEKESGDVEKILKSIPPTSVDIQGVGQVEVYTYNQVENMLKSLSPQTVTDWISVEDMLPDYGERVLVMPKGENIVVSVRVIKKGIDYWNDDNSDEHFQLDTVTHWQPLPQPPNKLTNKE